MKFYVLTYHEGHRDRFTEVRGVFASEEEAQKAQEELEKESNFYSGDSHRITGCPLNEVVR